MKVQLKSESKASNLSLFVDENKNILVDDQWKTQNQDLFAQLTDYLQLDEIKGKKANVQYFYPGKQKRVFLVFTGKEPSLKTYQKAGGQLGRKLVSFEQKELDVLFPNKEDFGSGEQYAFIEAALLGNYKFDEFKSKKNDDDEEQSEKISLEKLNFISDNKELKSLIEKADVFATSTHLARDWANKPGNEWTPKHFGEAAKKIAKETGMKVQSLGEKEMGDLGFGCLLGVSQGSEQEAFLHILEYKSKKKDADTIMLVGKGLTFDAGGVSLKPAGGMDEMKYDMCGGAAVMAAMRIIGLTKPDVNVIGLVPSSENLMNGKALKPGDILKSYSGKTVEILNTDAEGRLILCDAIAYGVDKYNPKVLIDVATLTGAVLVGLGKFNIGMLTNNENVEKQLKASATKTGDKVWPLPCEEEYGKLLESKYADLANIGGRNAGTITAGMYLKNFIGKDTQWAHLDIAGMAWDVKEFEYYPDKGATGVGVRLLADFVENWKSEE